MDSFLIAMWILDIMKKKSKWENNFLTISKHKFGDHCLAPAVSPMC